MFHPTTSLVRTYAIAIAGLTLPFLWPGLLINLFDTNFPQSHHDGWPTALTILQFGSDLLIGVAYTVIASVLAYIVFQHRRLIPFDWVVLAFGLFIVACGMTHVMHVVVRYTPVFWLDAYIRALTAIVSVATAVAIIPLIPRIGQVLNAERRVQEQQNELELANLALKAAASRAEFLAALSDALQSASSPSEIEALALERLTPALSAIAMSSLTVQDNHIVRKYIHGELPLVAKTLIMQPDFQLSQAPLLQEVLLTGMSLYLQDYAKAKDAMPGASNLAYAVEPIIRQDRSVAGCVIAWRASDIGPWNAEEQDLMRRGASTIGLALERVEAGQLIESQRNALSEANIALSHSNEELTQFASIASHDLQEPLRSIASFSSILNRKYASQIDEQGQKYLNIIDKSTQRMSTLIQDLLQYARLGASQPQLDLISLQEPFYGALQRLQGRIAEVNADITYDELPVIKGNMSELTQVFQNLLGNAIKFSKPGIKPKVHITAKQEERMWHIQIQDNGIGIEPEFIGKIFVTFNRLHSRDKYEGTGLGLSIAKKVIERHGGQIWVESKSGEGSIFHFTLEAQN